MVSIGHGIVVRNSMSHYPKRGYEIFNSPGAAQREVAIMRALKDGPLYTSIIRLRTKIKDRVMYKTLLALERAHMIKRTKTVRNTNCWKLVQT